MAGSGPCWNRCFCRSGATAKHGHLWPWSRWWLLPRQGLERDLSQSKSPAWPTLVSGVVGVVGAGVVCGGLCLAPLLSCHALTHHAPQASTAHRLTGQTSSSATKALRSNGTSRRCRTVHLPFLLLPRKGEIESNSPAVFCCILGPSDQGPGPVFSLLHFLSYRSQSFSSRYSSAQS